MNFAAGSRYFIVLHDSIDPDNAGWFVDPCGPTMGINSADQLAELRSLSNGEIVLSEPVILDGPNLVWVAGVAGIAAAAAGLLFRRRSSRPAPAAA